MEINGVIFQTDLITILNELKHQLLLNGIHLLADIKDTPDNVMITCPYHKDGQERRPSAGIKKDTGVFHCFTCQETHSLPEVISFCFGRDDNLGSFGWNWLLKNFLTISVEDRDDLDIDFNRTVRNTGIVNYVTEEELDSYRYYHPYMWKRKLTPEVVELFDIGYDKKRQAITFPVRDINGNTLFIARRSVNTKWFNYPVTATKPLYGIYEIKLYYEENKTKSREPVIICESMLDALYFWTIGKLAVALNGLGTQLQYKQIEELPCRKIILCTDMDNRGQKARANIRKNIKTKLITEYILPPGRKDANDCTVEELKNLEEIF